MKDFITRSGWYPISVLSPWLIRQVNRDMSVFFMIWLEDRALSNQSSILFSDTYQHCFYSRDGLQGRFTTCDGSQIVSNQRTVRNYSKDGSQGFSATSNRLAFDHALEENKNLAGQKISIQRIGLQK